MDRQRESFGAPLPGAPNVGSRVPAKPSRFEHWGAHEDLPLPNHALSLAGISKLSSTNSQHKRHKIYTGSGDRCGVIPYSSVVWWIASRAEDEQYKGKNSLPRRGVLELGELGGMVLVEWIRSKMSCLLWWWLVLFIEALVLFQNLGGKGSHNGQF